MKSFKTFILFWFLILAASFVLGGPYIMDENLEMENNSIYNASQINSTNFWQNGSAVLDVTSTVPSANSSSYWDNLNDPTEITSLGTVSSATSITSSSFVGPLVGNANSSTWWATVSGWVEGWFRKTGNNLDFNESKLNATGDARYVNIDGDTMTGNLVNTANITASYYNGNATNMTLERLLGSTYSTVQDLQNVFHSAGWVSGGSFSDNGDLTVNISAGTGLIRDVDGAIQTIFYFDWSASNNIAIAVNSVRYLGIEYNAGSPQVVTKTSDTWDYRTEFPLGTVIEDNGTLHITFNPQAVGDHASTMIQRSYGTAPLQRDARVGGLIIGETGTREISVTTGVLWDRLNKFTISAIDTSASDTFDRYYSNGSGGFYAERNQTQWNNTLYDDGSGTLATISNNRYSVQYFYVESDGELVSMYGQNQYVSLASVDNDEAPSSLPNRLAFHSRLIGRIIFQESGASAESVESAFENVFQPSLVSTHANLAGLTSDDHNGIYYSQTEIDTLISGVNFTAGDGITLTGTVFSLTYTTGQHLNSTSDVVFQNITTNNLNSINCIAFDSGGKICSGS